jgi:pyridoxine 4-dehydrogenase
MITTAPGGTLTLADDFTITRMGYGAMQLAGPGVFGPPRDRAAAVAVLREAVELGITHIDTADFYGPVVTNEIIREALHPYPDGLHIVTKVGARRAADGTWLHVLDPDDLRLQVRENLEHLGLDALDVVNLRLSSAMGTTDESVTDQFGALAELREQGLIRHLGLSGVTDAQLTEAQAIAPVVTVQNYYNVVERGDDALIERCEREGIAYAPFFPLGGFTPLQSSILDEVAAAESASAQQVALAWLLQRSQAIVVIPGTSSIEHLRENVAAAELTLSAESLVRLEGISAQAE